MMLQRLLFSLLTVNRCLLCGVNLPRFRTVSYDICPECTRLIREKRHYGSECIKCSAPLISEERTCMRCRRRSYSFDCNYSVFPYRDHVKELIYQYKFRNSRNLAYFFAEIFYSFFLKYFKAEMIVPVPASVSSTEKRGFDHMALIGRVLDKEYGQPVINCLSRKKGKSQKSLSYEQRLVNLVGNIHFKKGSCNLSDTVILLDDVFTTGATMEQCASVLIENGASHIIGLTIAID